VPLIILFFLIKAKGNARQRVFWAIKESFFYILTVFIFIYIDIFYIGFSNKELQYQPSFSFKQTLNSFGWYLAWSLGLPEMMLDFVGPGFHLNPNLMKYWGGYFKIIFPSFFVLITLIFSSFLLVLVKMKKKFLNPNILVWMIWFPIALSPVIFLPFHKFSYYLHPALPGFWIVVVYIIFYSYKIIATKSRKLAGLYFFTFVSTVFLISITSVSLANVTYWSANRGRIAKILISNFKKEYSSLPKGAIVYFQNDPHYPEIAADWGGSSKQAFFALSGSDAFQLLYRDPSIKVYYEDMGGPPSYSEQESIIKFVAKMD
jgi:hypothetical protein